ncbi:MAG: QcrA and Rieske domain-containing protein [Planctomycetota bacterium]|jgi:cytochrome b6-f complex iron-sulfur subunit
MDEPKQQTAEAQGSRRSFFWTLGLSLSSLALLEYIVVAADFLRLRKRRAVGAVGSIVRAGPVEQFEPGSVTAFPQGKFYLARLAGGGFLAMSRECTHLGCTVPWIANEGRFVCPCHASAYDINGDVVSPPAPRPLDLYEVRIENGIVKVDISRPVRRQKFELGQVTRT